MLRCVRGLSNYRILFLPENVTLDTLGCLGSLSQCFMDNVYLCFLVVCVKDG